jgi:hypothetical protein
MKHGRYVVTPRIRLEVMNKFQIVFVLVLTYSAVLLAILSGVYELRIGTVLIEQSGAQCGDSQLLSDTAVLGAPCTVCLPIHELLYLIRYDADFRFFIHIPLSPLSRAESIGRESVL